MERQFPEASDFDKSRWFHAYQATKEMIQNYDFDLEQPWQRNVPTILYQFGAMQHYIRPDEAIDSEKFSAGGFIFNIGQQINPSVKDIFVKHGNELPIAPALLITPDTVDGTSAPSYEAAEKPTNIKAAHNIADEDHANKMRIRFKSPRNQPRMGEFNNAKAPLYVNVDPRIRNTSKAVIFIATEVRGRSGQLRDRHHINTRFDPRHDTALHLKTTQQYQVLEIVKLDNESVQVNSIDDLGIKIEGQLLTQDWLKEHLDLLNGHKEGCFLIWSSETFYYHK